MENSVNLLNYTNSFYNISEPHYNTSIENDENGCPYLKFIKPNIAVACLKEGFYLGMRNEAFELRLTKALACYFLGYCWVAFPALYLLFGADAVEFTPSVALPFFAGFALGLIESWL